MSDMKSKTPRQYSSPTRELQASQTRERILMAVGGWLQAEAPGEITYAALAQEAGGEGGKGLRHL